MPTQKELNIVLSAQDNASSTFKKVADNAKHAADQIDSHGGGGGFLGFGRTVRAHELHERASGVKSVERLLMGAGVLGIYKFALEGVGKAAESANKHIENILQGNAKFTYFGVEMAKDFAKALPLGQQVFDVLDNLKEMVENYGAAKARAAGVSLEKVFGMETPELQLKQMLEMLPVLQALNRVHFESTNEDFAARHPKGTDRERAIASIEFRNRQFALQELKDELDRRLKDTPMPPGIRNAMHGYIDEADKANLERKKSRYREIDESDAQERARVQREGEDKVTQYQSEAEEKRLRLKRQDFAADLLVIKQHYKQLEDEAFKAGLALIEKDPSNRALRETVAKRFEAERRARKLAEQADIVGAGETDRIRQQERDDHRLEITRKLMETQAQLFQLEAIGGKAGASAMADKLRIASEYLEKEKALRDIIADRDATEQQKSGARVALGNLKIEKQIAEHYANVGVATAHIAPTDSSRFLRDLPAAKLEQYSRDQLNELKLIRELVQQLKDQPPVSYGGGGDFGPQ